MRFTHSHSLGWHQKNFFMTLCGGVVCLFFISGLNAHSSDRFWKAGIAKTDITPAEGLWMAGYASREKPAEGRLMSLWVKVLALEDAEGHRGVILTSDTLGIPLSIYRNVAGALEPRAINSVLFRFLADKTFGHAN